MNKDDRNQIYRNCFQALGIKQFELARLMALGEVTKSTRNKVSEKLKGADRGVTKESALAIQLLLFLKQTGVDITGFKFDESGRLIEPHLKINSPQVTNNYMADIQLHMTLEQAKAVSLGLDIFTRLGLGQLEYLKENMESGVIPQATQEQGATDNLKLENLPSEGIQTFIDGIRGLLGYSPGASHGINSPAVDMTVKRAFEIKKVLDRAVTIQSSESLPANVDQDPLPIRYTDDESPIAIVNNSRFTG